MLNKKFKREKAEIENKKNEWTDGQSELFSKFYKRGQIKIHYSIKITKYMPHQSFNLAHSVSDIKNILVYNFCDHHCRS